MQLLFDRMYTLAWKRKIIILITTHHFELHCKKLGIKQLRLKGIYPIHITLALRWFDFYFISFPQQSSEKCNTFLHILCLCHQDTKLDPYVRNLNRSTPWHTAINLITVQWFSSLTMAVKEKKKKLRCKKSLFLYIFK